jgi:RimJ/RimL family protein N-acetyltransferase
MEKLPENFTLERYGLQVRLVNEDDAEFIVALRTDPRLSKFIHETLPSVEEQKQWIRNYKKREAQGLDYYFMFSVNNMRQGVARIYNITEDAFTQGSWVFSPDAFLGASVLGNIISCEIGFDFLHKQVLYTDARRENTTHRYVQSFNPEIINTDEENIYYRIWPENYNQGKLKHIRQSMNVMQHAVKEKK